MDDDQIQALQKKAREVLEKRNFERFRARLQVRFRPIDPSRAAEMISSGDFALTASEKGRAKETKDLFKVMTDDLSQGGLRIVTPTQVAVGAIMAVDIHLPDIPLPVSALAQTMWVAENPGGGWACGLRFTQINRADLGKLERFLLLQRKSSH